MGTVIGGRGGCDASERCLIFQHHLLWVLQAGCLVCVRQLPRVPCSRTPAARSGVTCFKQLHDATRPTTNHTAFDDVVNPPLEEFLASPSEPPLPLAAGDGDNQKVEGGERRRRRRARPDLEAEADR